MAEPQPLPRPLHRPGPAPGIAAQAVDGLRVLGRLWQASLASQLRYPGALVLLTVAQGLVTGMEALALWALFQRFGALPGWTLAEVAVFYGLVNTMFALADMLGRGFDVLGTELLRGGDFDRLLLRPRRLALQLIGHELRLSRLGRLLQGLAVLGWALAQLPATWGAAQALLLGAALAGGVALFLGVLVMQATLSFWSTDSLELANVLSYGGVQAAQYPLAIYARWLRWTLSVSVPLAAVAYYPVLAVLGRADPLGAPAWLGWVSPLAGGLFLAAALAVWRLGVRRHQSTGS